MKQLVTLAIVGFLMLICANKVFAQLTDSTYADSIARVRENAYQDSIESAQLKGIIVNNNYIDTSVYSFNKLIKQSNGNFRFWKHKTDTLMRWETDISILQ